MAQQTGAVEISLEAGGDFELLPNGDLKLAIDTPNTTDATRQRLIRLLLTSPRLFDDAGRPVSTPDDLFNPTYGAGLPAEVGQPPTEIVPAIQARVIKALRQDPSVDRIQPIEVAVKQVGVTMVQVSVTCTAISGDLIVIPSLPLLA